MMPPGIETDIHTMANAGDDQPRNAHTAAMPGRATGSPADDRVRTRHSLRTRMALWSGAISIALLAVVLLGTAYLVRQLIVTRTHQEALSTARDAAMGLDNAMRAVMITTTGLSDLVAHSNLDDDELVITLRAMVRATPDAFGALLALEPRGTDAAMFARYVSVDNGKDRDFVADGYDYRTQDWYKRTLSSPAGWWSEPYYSETAGNLWMVTYNMPLHRADDIGRAQGMISLDLPLTTLTSQIRLLGEREGWRVSLVAPAGMLAANPVHGVALHETLDSYIARYRRSDMDGIAAAVRKRRAGQFLHLDQELGETRYTAVEPVGDSGWMLFVSQSDKLVVARLYRALLLLTAVAVVLALVSIWLLRRLARSISRPLEQLALSAAHFGHGEFDKPPPHTGRRDEVGLLARSLEFGRTSIRQQLDEIEAMGAARQKLESELSIARDIQLAMLPHNRVIERDHTRLEAHAVLEPAKAVGGDFYCFIERGDDELWFAIGDVSDKGVPAALFMARTVTMLEVAAGVATAPDRMLAEASRRLVEGNDTCMFATVLCGRIDVRTGEFVLASAGHESPLLLRASGESTLLDMQAGAPLGFEASEDFPVLRGQLFAGDSLLAYTDGITEAFDVDDQAFGDQRMLAEVRPLYSAQDNCERLVAQVHAFAVDREQSDDITVLAIRLVEDAAGNATHADKQVE